ncbi:molybdopterin synthase sulfur carrier subunit, partial [Ralstonia solanacearum]
MQIELRFFASVRAQLGTSHEAAAVPDTVRTVGELRRCWPRAGRRGA